jgi:catechol 2,3-dioxygenase-like lactoylglutathione lyase family enzyme
MTWNAAQGTLIVAPNNQSDLLYEIPTTAGLVLQPNNIINAAGGSGILDRISGLGMGPTTGGGGNSYWMADRNSNGIFEFTTNALLPTAPIAYNRTISVPFNIGVAANLVATDSNNDTLTYTIVDPPDHGVLNPATPGGAARTYTPTAGYVGPDTFTFTASDGSLTSNTATMTLNVQAANTAPVLAAISTPKTVNELDLLTFQATATDPEANAITFSLVNAPAGATITSTGIFNWRPSEAQGPGAYDITVRVTDSGGLFDSQVVRVNVNEVGSPPPPPPNNNPFIDDDGNIFEDAIEWLRAEGITLGCNPPVNNKFCPNDRVTRGQMAAFLVRALGYTAGGSTNYFVDDNGNIFETSINRLRAAEVTLGCNPPSNNRYCPNDFVTRGQMAAFLVRALGYTAGGNTNYFVDDNGSVFETQINRLRAAGVTLGCNPPANNRFCPSNFVTRGQMAAFLQRALDT